MKQTVLFLNRRALILLLAASLGGCSLFKSAKNIEKATENIEKATEPKAQPGETHEGPLLDNKVTAMRVQDALKSEGNEFAEVKVTGTKNAVVLTGKVKTSKARARAEEIARTVQRKMVLKNELEVGK